MQELFCLVFARYEIEGLRRLQVLGSEISILRLFSEPNATEQCCLLLHTKEQNHFLETFGASTLQRLPTPRGDLSPSSSSNNEAWDGDTDTLSNSMSPLSSTHRVELMIFLFCTGSHLLHGTECSTRHVQPEVTQKNLEECWNVKHIVNKEQQHQHMTKQLPQHTKQKGRGGRKMMKEEKKVRRAAHSDLELLPVPTNHGADATVNAPKPQKQKRSKRWFKKFSSRSVEDACDASQDSPEQGERIKQSKGKKKWSIRSKGQHKGNFAELERCRSLIISHSQQQLAAKEGKTSLS